MQSGNIEIDVIFCQVILMVKKIVYKQARWTHTADDNDELVI